MKMLCFLLRQRGKKVWYDNEMANRSTAAMEEGVKHSAHFLIFLSGDPDLSLALAPPPEGVPPEPEPETADPASVEDFLGRNNFAVLKSDLDELGVEEVEDLKELEAEDIERLSAKLKKVQAKKFAKKIAALQA